MTRITKTIHIYYENPPTPHRNDDYVALYVGEEECRNYGYGSTMMEALRDLIETNEE